MLSRWLIQVHILSTAIRHRLWVDLAQDKQQLYWRGYNHPTRREAGTLHALHYIFERVGWTQYAHVYLVRSPVQRKTAYCQNSLLTLYYQPYQSLRQHHCLRSPNHRSHLHHYWGVLRYLNHRNHPCNLRSKLLNERRGSTLSCWRIAVLHNLIWFEISARWSPSEVIT